MNILLLAGLFLTLPTSSDYSAVVVDARTNRPLAGVNVRDVKAPAPTAPVVTDATGRFTLSADQVHIQFNMLGYAPLVINQLHPQGDTIRLLPQAMVLSEVSVRPPKATILSTVPPKGSTMDRRILPGQSVALLVTPPVGAPVGQACVLDQVRLFMADRVKEGRLRIRLVNVVPGAGLGSAAQPGLADLLPEPALYSAAQLSDLSHGRLILDIAKYGLLLPPEGLCVVIECLPTNPADKPVAVTVPAGGKGKLHVVVASDPTDPTTSHVLEADDFPLLSGQRGLANNPTWSRSTSKPQWRQLGGANVHAELTVYTY